MGADNSSTGKPPGRRNRSVADDFFRDKSGRLVLVQFPNAYILIWLGATLLRHFVHLTPLRTGLSIIATASLAWWAWLELTEGVNYFRRLLGLIVAIAVAAGVIMSLVQHRL